MKKNLILYGSVTGNTEKIAKKLKVCFERHGWDCTLKKLPKDYDVENPDFEFDDYDFVCVGSPVRWDLPLSQVRKVMTSRSQPNGKIVPGPKSAIVFCTYGGIHLGPKEAEPTLKLLELAIEHLKFRVIGSLAIPGSMGEEYSPDWYHGDTRDRPNEEDLRNVGKFVDETIEKMKFAGN